MDILAMGYSLVSMIFYTKLLAAEGRRFHARNKWLVPTSKPIHKFVLKPVYPLRETLCSIVRKPSWSRNHKTFTWYVERDPQITIRFAIYLLALVVSGFFLWGNFVLSRYRCFFHCLMCIHMYTKNLTNTCVSDVVQFLVEP